MVATPSPGRIRKPGRRSADPVEPARPVEAAPPDGGTPLPGLAVPVRPSLRVGAVHDPAELEAESVAELVVDALRRSPVDAAGGVSAGADAAGGFSAGADAAGGFSAGGEASCCDSADHQHVRRAPAAGPVIGAAGGAVDDAAAASIGQLKGGGQALPDGIRRSMESAFGTELPDVRVHTGPTASRLNDQLGAHAFTAGNDIVFADGLPDVSQPDGQRLMAHELTHVLQNRGADTLSAMRRQAATVARHAAPASDQPEPLQVGMLTVSAAPGQHAAAEQDPDAIRRVFDVAIKPVLGMGNVLYVENIVISDRPKGPSTAGMEQHGGKSFHHESAYAWIEKQVTQYAGQKLADVVAHMVGYGLDKWTKMPDPGPDSMAQVIALNKYFHQFLASKAKEAEGWLGSTGGHSSQGGKVSSAIKALKSSGWSKANVDNALSVSFEPGPTVKGEELWQAAEAHADAFYAANQRILEDEGPDATINLKEHEDIVEWLKTWATTEYWQPEFDEMHVEEQD